MTRVSGPGPARASPTVCARPDRTRRAARRQAALRAKRSGAAGAIPPAPARAGVTWKVSRRGRVDPSRSYGRVTRGHGTGDARLGVRGAPDPRQGVPRSSARGARVAPGRGNAGPGR